MSVVNCKVKFIRPEYSDLKDWTLDENNVYIGRSGVVFIDKKRFPQKGSIFANPYKIGKDGSRQETLDKYQIYITNKLKTDENFKTELLKLYGKNLGCWCFPEPCHGDILLKIIQQNIDKETKI